MNQVQHRSDVTADQHFTLLTGAGLAIRVIAVVATLAVLAVLPPVSALGLDNGQEWSLDFPRLGMTWPDVTKQTAADIARWDYVLLKPQQKGIVPSLRAIKPGIVLLTSTNAQELGLNLSVPPGNSGNIPISEVPNDWILTQYGSTLAARVGPSDTTLTVVQADRFRAGDIVVIEDELLKVKSVGTNSIGVVRGLLPERSVAATHAAGVRLAAAVVFWPGSVVMNLTGYCPKVTVDPSIGPETWGEYNARVGKRLLSEADWDGIFVDRSNRGAAFMTQTSYTRSIDARRTNTPVPGDNLDLDASYRIALRDYLTRLRASAPTAVIMANNGDTNYGLLNGTALENSPVSSWTVPQWRWRMFRGGVEGSYADWAELSPQPNLTTNLTYESESSPVSGAVFVNPFGTPGWHPNYKKMRFGLATTLMNNGFFDYEINTAGHGALGLLWFDEYDNAGQARGYLGQPTGAARMALPPLATADKLAGHGSFSTTSQLAAWGTWVMPGYTIQKSLINGVARLIVTGPRRMASASAQFYHGKVWVAKGGTYTLSFRAKASTPLTIGMGVVKASSGRGYISFGTVPVGTAWKTYQLEGVSNSADAAARLLFLVGGKNATIRIDDVKFQSGKRWEVYRRDFAGGTALVNPTSKVLTVPLDRVFRKIAGTQDSITNNGEYVSSVTLASQDGLVLLATPSMSVPGDLTTNYGVPVTIAGVLKSVKQVPLASRAVTLYESDDRATWRKTADATTTADGGYSFRVAPIRNRYYRARFEGDADNLKGFSRVLAVKVRAYVSTPYAPATASHSKSFAVYGYLKPRHSPGGSAVRVYRWRYVSGRWKSYGYVWAKTSDFKNYSKYSQSIMLSTAGRWRIRAFHADSGHAATWSSNYDYVTVK